MNSVYPKRTKAGAAGLVTPAFLIRLRGCVTLSRRLLYLLIENRAALAIELFHDAHDVVDGLAAAHGVGPRDEGATSFASCRFASFHGSALQCEFSSIRIRDIAFSARETTPSDILSCKTFPARCISLARAPSVRLF